jgi:hypothetical protein
MHGRLRVEPTREQGEDVGTVGHLGGRLGGDGTDADPDLGDDGPDGDELAGDGDAHRVPMTDGDREGHGP